MHLYRILPWFLSLCFAVVLGAQPTNEEINAALDVEGDIEWNLNLGEGSTLEIVDMEGAVGGTAVKFVIPPRVQSSISTIVSGPAVFWYNYWVDDLQDRGSFLVVESTVVGDESGTRTEGGVAADWNAVKMNILNEGTVTIVNWYGSGYGSYEERVLYLDNLKKLDGYSLENEGFGLTVIRTPDREIYEPGEWVRLEAEPIGPDYEFLEWDRFGIYTMKSPILYRDAYEARGVNAIGLRRYSVGGVEMLVSLTGVELELSDGGSGVDLTIDDDNGGRVLFRSNERGVLTMEAGLPEKWSESIGGILRTPLAEELQTVIYEVVEPNELFSLGLYGSHSDKVQIRNLDFRAGFGIIEIDTIGNGSIVGLPENGIVDLSSVLNLEAVPDEGWYFGGWSGGYRSGEAVIAFEPLHMTPLIAHFYKIESLAGRDARVFESDGWSENLDTDISSVVSPERLAPYATATIEWEFEGPGELSFEYVSSASKADVYVDGEFYSSLGNWGSNTVREFVLPMQVGSSTVRIEVRNVYGSIDYNAKVIISNMEWSSGYPVSVRSNGSGDVTGVDSNVEYFPYGTVLNLRAVADEGSRLLRWEGTIEQREADLSIEVRGALDLLAVFETPSANADWVTVIEGREWTYVDGGWETPEMIILGEESILKGRIEGPALLSFVVEDLVNPASGYISYGVVGKATNTARVGVNELILPEGFHDVYLVAGSNYSSVSSRAIKEVKLSYKVEIEMDQAAFSSDPILTYGSWDYVEQGTEFTFGPSELVSGEITWTGDLSGQPESGSIVVDGPIKGGGYIQLTSFDYGSLQWELVGLGESFLYAGGLSVDPTIEEGVLKTQLQGPGRLLVRARGISSLNLHLNGEELDIQFQSSDAYMYYLPEGVFEVDLVVRPDSEIPDDGWNRDNWIQYISYDEGYLVHSWGTGGLVTKEPDLVGYSKGAEVRFTATESLGNEFVGWGEPFEGEESDFTVVVEDYVVFEAVFQASSTIDDVSIDYGGPRPAFRKASVFGGDSEVFNGGYWLYEIPEGDFAQRSVSISVEGPAVLSPIGDFLNYLRQGELTFSIDGVARGIPGVYEVIRLSEGIHTLKWTINPDSSVSGFRRVELPFLLQQTEFHVLAMATDAVLDNSNPKDVYALGDELILTAPEIDDNGSSFLGWKITSDGFFEYKDSSGYRGPFLSEERVLSVVVDGSLSVEAVFGDQPRSVGVASVWGLDLLEEDELVRSPKGEGSLFAEDSSKLRIAAEEDSVIRFSVRSEGSGASLRFSGVESLVNKNFYAGEEWSDFQIYLKAGEALSLEFNANGSAKWWIGDLEIVEGWGPTLVYEGEGRIVSRVSDDGIAVYPEFPSEDLFLGWVESDGPLNTTIERVVEVDSSTLLRPVFGEDIESEVLGTVLVSSYQGWKREISTISNEYWVSGGVGSELSFEIEGPRVVKFRPTRFDLEDPGIYLDGIATGNVAYWDEFVYVGVPEGTHRVRIARTLSSSSAFSLHHFSIHAGYLFEGSDGAGGKVTVPGEVVIVPEGEEVAFAAIPDGGYEFDGWEAPFENEGQFFSLASDRAERPVARFREVELSYEFLGLKWTSKGPVSSGKVCVESVITGPVVIMGERTDLGQLKLNGESLTAQELVVAEWSRLSNGSRIYRLGIPSGEQLLSLEISYNGDPDFEDEFEISPGCLVAVDGLGASVHVDPIRKIYPVGSSVSVRHSASGSAGDLEWMGVPDHAVSDDNGFSFEVTDHVSVTGALFRDTSIGGTRVSYAGDADWAPDNWGVSSIPGLSAGEHVFVRFSPSRVGTLHFDSSIVSQNTYRPSVFGDLLINSEKRDDFGDISGTVGSVELKGADIVEWSYVGNVWSVSSHNIQFNELMYEVLLREKYMDWWRGIAPVVADDVDAISPWNDYDEDGLSNYLEYLLLSDPTRYGAFLTMYENTDTGMLTLSYPIVPQDVRDDVNIEYTRSLSGNSWSTALNLLSDSENDGFGNEERVILKTESDDVPLFFKVSYEGETPSLEELDSE